MQPPQQLNKMFMQQGSIVLRAAGEEGVCLN
jgi:hypothetical protein